MIPSRVVCIIDSLRPLSTAPCPCKICGGPATPWSRRFHESCEEVHGVRLSLSGVPIYYRRCADCKFLFTDAFDDWNTEQFKTYLLITMNTNSSIPTIRSRGRERTPNMWQAYGEQLKEKRASSILAAATICFAGYCVTRAFR